MIELSKCPNCASEDKVTIAGKDFCMRCGTPSQDTNQASSANSTQSAGDGTVPPPIDQNPASVSKFTDPANVTASQPANDTVATIPANTTSAANAVSQTDGNISLPPQAVEQPTQVPAPQPMSNMQSPAPMAPGQNPTQLQTPSTDNSVPAVNMQTAQAQSPVLTQEPVDSTNNPMSVTQPVANGVPINLQQTTANVPAPIQQPEVATTPDPVQIPQDQPLTQASPANDSVSTPEDVNEPKIHTHQSIMSLDKNDSGVFSDEQLDELSKISDQSEPLSMSADQPKTNVANSGSVAPATFHTDIQPPGASKPAPEPTPATQSAVGKVVDTEIKVPDKNTKGKKVLKPAGIALSIVALFLVGAYIWQVNYPTLAFKIASSKAGMSASMPGYMPGGYKLAGEIQTNPGSVSYNLVNGGQNTKISISQTKTDWDSQALAENYVAPKAENYLALQAQGLTIYMLGDSQATWVNKGTWYKIESPDQSLSQDQAIKIATSL